MARLRQAAELRYRRWMLRPCWIRVIACAALALVASARAEPPQAALAPGTLLLANDLELAAWAQATGDEAVLKALGSADLATRFTAARATVWLAAPELALLPLAGVAAGRDPDLAAVAARRSLRIAQALMLRGLAVGEVLPGDLRAARAALSEVAGMARVRADIRMLAAQAAELLRALGVPAGGA